MANLGTVGVMVEPDMTGMKKKTQSGFSRMGKLAMKAFAAAFVVKKAFDFGASAINAAEEYGTLVSGASSLIAQQQKALGDAASLTTDHVVAQADALQRLSGISNEQVLSGERMLLTFQAIQNEGEGTSAIFDRATAALTDLVAAEAFGDMKSGAIALGKALQDPVQGITAMSRAGVTFTEQQKEQVKAMVEAGDTLGAQQLIMDEIEKVYGGTAEASRNATDVIKNAWNDVKVNLANELMPVLERLAVWVADVAIPTFERWWPVIQETGRQLIDTFTTMWEKVEPIYEAFRSGIETVASWFQRHSEDIRGEADGTRAWLSDVWGKISVIFSKAMTLISAIINRAVTIWRWIWDNFGDEIMTTFRFVWNTVKNVIDTVLGVISGLLDVFTGLFTGDWQLMWDGVKRIVSAAWNGIRRQFGLAFGYLANMMRTLGPKLLRGLGNLGGLLVNAGRSMIAGLWRGALNAFGFVVGWFKRLPGLIISGLGDLGRTLWDLGSSLISGLLNGIRSKAGAIVTAIKNTVIDKIPGPIKSFFGIHSPSRLMQQYGASISEGLAVGITGGAPGVTKAVGRLLNGPSGALDLAVAGGGAGGLSAGRPYTVTMMLDGRVLAEASGPHLVDDLILHSGQRR